MAYISEHLTCNKEPSNFGTSSKLFSKETEARSEFWCETCDRSFQTYNFLDEHRRQHRTCNIDGCQFVAHPKVIIRHVQMQHSTGLYSKVANLNDPEEIKRWKEDRRKKYPTKANIEKKNAEAKEKIERGEKMNMSRRGQKTSFSKQKEFNRKHKFQNRSFTRKNDVCKRNATDKKLKVKIKFARSKETNDYLRLKPFGGIQCLLLRDEVENDNEPVIDPLNIEDNEWMEDTPKLCLNKISSELGHDYSVCNALSNLISNYGSSDDDNESGNTKNKVPNTVQSLNSNINEGNTVMSLETSKNNTECISDDDSGPEESKIVRESQSKTENDIEVKENKVIKKRNESVLRCNRGSIKKHVKYNNIKRKLPSTLLEKLLSSEIRHERNVTLQCIRYVVKNNYFTKNQISDC